MQTSFQNISKIETSIPNDIAPLNMQPYKKKKNNNWENRSGQLTAEYLIWNRAVQQYTVNKGKQDGLSVSITVVEVCSHSFFYYYF